MSPKTIEEQYDAVIVGAGAAGLSAALGFYRNEAINDLVASGIQPKVLVVSKMQALRSHTGSAEGGIAASLGNIEPDSWQWHYYDTVKGGDYLVDQDAAKILAQYAPETVINLERSGVAFSRTHDGHIAQRRFGGHTKDYGKEPVERAAYSADRIGHQILHTLWQQCVAYGVQFAEEWVVTDLCINTDDARCEGVVVYNTHTGATHALHARNVLLATGGAGRLFQTTSNSYDLTGDGMALVLNAGLQLEDSEFVQFHPTGLAHTGILLSEASRAEGGILRNALGEAFMERYAPEHKDLAARDVVSRAIRSEIQAGRGVADPKDPQGEKDCVWLDLTHIDTEHMNNVLPQVVQTIRDYAGLDPSKDLIAIKPTAHYTMGGIPITTDGNVYTWNNETRIPIEGLYAAGECSCVSVHGANRLGGNSLLDACLFGTRAGRSIATNVAQHPVDDPTEQVNTDTTILEQTLEKRKQAIHTTLEQADSTQQDNPYQVMQDLGALMDKYLAVVTNASQIAQALEQIDTQLIPRARQLVVHSDTPTYNQEITAIWEANNLLVLARTMLRSMQARQESRGSLYRTDFPQRNDEQFLAHSMIDIAHDEPMWQPVHIVDIEPTVRAY